MENYLETTTARKKNKASPKITVRITSPSMYEKLIENKEKYGISPAEQMRRAYSNNPVLTKDEASDDVKKFLVEIGRIGNNINQISKNLNSINYQNVDNDMKAVRASLAQLYRIMTE